MNCRQAEKWMDATLDEGLGATDPAATPEPVRAHFDACGVCRRQWETLLQAETALRSPRMVPAPEGMLAEFRSRLAVETKVAELRPPSRKPWAWLWPAGSLAAAALAAAVVWTVNPQYALKTSAARPVAEAPVTFDVPAPSSTAASPTTAANAPKPPKRAESTAEKTEMAPTNSGSAGMSAGTQTFGRFSSQNSVPALAAAPSSPNGVAEGSAPVERKPPETSRPSRTATNRIQPQGMGVASLPERFKRVPPTAERVAIADMPGVTASPEAGGVAGAFGAGIGSAPLLKADAVSQTAIGLRTEAPGAKPLAQMTPTELAAEVSPAVVMALQRTVAPVGRTEELPDALRRLSGEADVEMLLEGKIAELGLIVAGKRPEARADVRLHREAAEQPVVPLWIALQELALRSRLEILPAENRLVLRLAAMPRPEGAGPSQREARLQTTAPPAPSSRKNFAKKPEAAKLATKAAPSSLLEANQLRYRGAAPDPQAWPKIWGDLPQWGFVPPDERPKGAEHPAAAEPARQEAPAR